MPATSPTPVVSPFTPEPPCIRVDLRGTWRVGESQVLVDVVIEAFTAGATPEEIVSNYPTASLGDVYCVIAFYLRHRDTVQAYLDERERQALATRQRVEQMHDERYHKLRERILTRQRQAESP
jgi:uncharacterized protein (DUF433 family)